MIHKNYLLYFMVMGISYTSFYPIIADSSSQQTLEKSSTTEQTTPEKKEICPHSDIPTDELTAKQLEELLACKKSEVEQLEELTQETKAQKSPVQRKRKPIINAILEAPRCPYGSTPLKNLNQKQLEEVYKFTTKHPRESAFMIDLLDRLIVVSDNHADVKKYKLQLADEHYKVHHLEKAAALYEDFAVLYPGSKENEYVLYKALACMFELSLSPDRDQTNTKKTIMLAKEFLKHATDKNLRDEAKSILQTCYNRLYEHEVYIFNFYLKKKNFKAASLRLDYIKENFTKTINNLDEKVNELTQIMELVKNPVKKSKKQIVKKMIA